MANKPANEPDIKLLFGVQGGDSITVDGSSGKEIFDNLKRIVSNINGKDVLKIKVSLDDDAAEEFKKQIKGIISESGIDVDIKIKGLDQTATDAGKAAKSLDDVASSAKKAGQAAKKSSSGALAKGTKEYADALTNINRLLIQLRNNQRNWSAAYTGWGEAAFKDIEVQITALQSLKDKLVDGKLTAKDFANEMSQIRSRATEAAETINKLGENHAATEQLVVDTEEYNAALTKTYNLIGQVATKLNQWTAAQHGVADSSYGVLSNSISSLNDLISDLMLGNVDIEYFNKVYGDISLAIATASADIKLAGENMREVAPPERLTADTEKYNVALTKVYNLIGQVVTRLNQWTAAQNGVSASSYNVLTDSLASLNELVTMLFTGIVDVPSFNEIFSDINRNVAYASSEIKKAGENMREAASPEVVKRLAKVNAELKEISTQNSTLTSQYKKITAQGQIDGVSTSQIDALKVKYMELLEQTELLRMNRNSATDEDIAGVRLLQVEVGRLTSDILTQAEASRVAAASSKATTGEQDEQKASLKEVVSLYEKIVKYIKKNPRAEGTDHLKRLKDICAELGAELDGIDTTSDKVQYTLSNFSKADIKSKTNEVAFLQGRLREAGKDGMTLGETISAAYKKFGGWMMVTQSLTKIINGLKQMVNNVAQLDAAMTELKKVTNETEAAYNKFLDNAPTRARQLGASLTDIVNATADFSRLGNSIEDASKLADAALVYKNVGDGIEDISEASASIISTMQAFGIQVDEVMSIVDKFNNVGNRHAISSKGVGEALLNSASALKAAGNTLDETIALITAAI